MRPTGFFRLMTVAACLGACALSLGRPSGQTPGPSIIAADHYHALLLSAPHHGCIWWDNGLATYSTKIVVLPPSDGVVGFYDEKTRWGGQYRILSQHEGKTLYEVEIRPTRGPKQVWRMSGQ